MMLEASDVLGGQTTIDDAVAETARAMQLSTTNSLGDFSNEAYSYAAATAWGLIWGQCRGRIPGPVPFDLAAVALSVGLRILDTLEDSGTVHVQGAEIMDTRASRFQGLNLSELACLWRYRVRTA